MTPERLPSCSESGRPRAASSASAASSDCWVAWSAPAAGGGRKRPLRAAARALALASSAAAALVTGCASSPASHFYTLSAGGDTTSAVAPPAAANPALLIELAPVDVPQQVAKPQLVVQNDATQVRVLEQERWASLPGDEIRRALSGDLTQQLGTIDVYGSPHPDGLPVYRVSVNVQRFESWPGSHALIDAVWSVRSLASQAVMTCRSVVEEPVGDGYDALVAGHRRAVEDLATAISGGVRSLAAQPFAATTKARTTTRAAIPCPLPTAAAGPDLRTRVQ